jgi:hypothetical protein
MRRRFIRLLAQGSLRAPLQVGRLSRRAGPVDKLAADKMEIGKPRLQLLGVTARQVGIFSWQLNRPEPVWRRFTATVGSVVPSTIIIEPVPSKAARDVPTLRPYDFAVCRARF